MFPLYLYSFILQFALLSLVQQCCSISLLHYLFQIVTKETLFLPWRILEEQCSHVKGYVKVNSTSEAPCPCLQSGDWNMSVIRLLWNRMTRCHINAVRWNTNIIDTQWCLVVVTFCLSKRRSFCRILPLHWESSFLLVMYWAVAMNTWVTERHGGVTGYSHQIAEARFYECSQSVISFFLYSWFPLISENAIKAIFNVIWNLKTIEMWQLTWCQSEALKIIFPNSSPCPPPHSRDLVFMCLSSCIIENHNLNNAGILEFFQ